LNGYGADIERYDNPQTKAIYLEVPNSKKYYYYIQIVSLGENYNQYIELANEILSTFKFTDSNSATNTSDWKTYSSKTFVAKYPQDWSKFKFPQYEPYMDEDVIFRSPDYEENAIPVITKGAEIDFYKKPNTKNQSLESYIESSLPTPLADKAKGLENMKLGNNSYKHLFVCWEGCFDKYYLENNGSFYIVNFQCAPNCNTEENIAKNKYYRDVNTFLENFEFSRP
jgi:hypothetical protein